MSIKAPSQREPFADSYLQWQIHLNRYTEFR